MHLFVDNHPLLTASANTCERSKRAKNEHLSASILHSNGMLHH